MGPVPGPLRRRGGDGDQRPASPRRRPARPVRGPSRTRCPDPAIAGTLRRALAGSTAPLKARLLDQAHLAGVGNLIADEALWRAGLSPLRPAGSLDETELRRLAPPPSRRPSPTSSTEVVRIPAGSWPSATRVATVRRTTPSSCVRRSAAEPPGTAPSTSADRCCAKAKLRRRRPAADGSPVGPNAGESSRASVAAAGPNAGNRRLRPRRGHRRRPAPKSRRALTAGRHGVPSTGFEPAPPAPEAGALSPELRGRGPSS